MRSVAFLAVGSLAASRFSSAAAASDVPPVILVPGLTGSTLEAQLHDVPMPHFFCTKDTGDSWMRVWIAPQEVLPLEKDCLISRLTLTYDPSSDTYSNLPGLKLRTVGFGASVDGHDLLYRYEYGTLVDHLASNLGYELGSNLLIAPYDWRLAGDSHSEEKNGIGGFYPQLKQLIEDSVKSTGRKAVVASHSLGCPMMLYFFHRFVSEEWRATNMQGWVAMSGPWGGGTMQANAYMGGWNLGLPSWLLPHDYVKPVQVNASSGVYIAPQSHAFGNATIVSTPTRNYTAADLPHMIERIGDQAGGEQALALWEKLSGHIPALQRAPEGMEMLNWYSNGVQTSERYHYKEELGAGFNAAPAHVDYGDGDGLVNLLSLALPETSWPAAAGLSNRVFPNCSHFGMLSDSRVLGALVEYLSSGSQGSEPILV